MTTPIDQSFILQQVKEFSEIEMQAFIEELQNHLYKNKMGHLLPDQTERVEEVESNYYELEEEFNNYKQRSENAREAIQNAIKNL